MQFESIDRIDRDLKDLRDLRARCCTGGIIREQLRRLCEGRAVSSSVFETFIDSLAENIEPILHGMERRLSNQRAAEKKHILKLAEELASE